MNKIMKRLAEIDAAKAKLKKQKEAGEIMEETYTMLYNRRVYEAIGIRETLRSLGIGVWKDMNGEWTFGPMEADGEDGKEVL